MNEPCFPKLHEKENYANNTNLQCIDKWKENQT